MIITFYSYLPPFPLLSAPSETNHFSIGFHHRKEFSPIFSPYLHPFSNKQQNLYIIPFFLPISLSPASSPAPPRNPSFPPPSHRPLRSLPHPPRGSGTLPAAESSPLLCTNSIPHSLITQPTRSSDPDHPSVASAMDPRSSSSMSHATPRNIATIICSRSSAVGSGTSMVFSNLLRTAGSISAMRLVAAMTIT